MNTLTEAKIRSLMQSSAKTPMITIYMPSHRFGTPPNMTEDQVRYKNMLKQVRKIIELRGAIESALRRQLVERLEALQGNQSFWRDQAESLLLLANPDELTTFNLPIDCDEYVAVDNHYHLAPVFSLLNDQQDYYVLALSQQGPALYRGNMYRLEPADIVLPGNLKDALNIDESFQRSVQFHSVSGNVGGGGKGAEYHGHGGGKDTGDAERLHFWRLIDHIICSQADTELPLIVAGIDSEVAEYRDITKYPHITQRHLSGNFSDTNIAEMFPETWDIISNEVVDAQHRAAADRYKHASGANPELVSSEAASIKDATEAGKVDALLIRMSRITSDTVKDNVGQVRKIVFPSEAQSQFIDSMAMQVWHRGGAVINLTDDLMPVAGVVAAMYRY